MDNWACGARQGSPSSSDEKDAAEAPQPQLLHLRPHATHEPWPRSPRARAREIVASRSTSLAYSSTNSYIVACIPHFPKQCTRSR